MLLKGFKWGRVMNEWMRTEKFPLGWSAWWSLDFWPVTKSSTSRVHIPWYIEPSAPYLLCWCLGLPTTEIWGEEHIFLILSSRWHVTLIASNGRVSMAGPSYKCVSSLQLGHFPREEMLYREMMASPQADTHCSWAESHQNTPFLGMWKWENLKYLLHLKLF